MTTLYESLRCTAKKANSSQEKREATLKQNLANFITYIVPLCHIAAAAGKYRVLVNLRDANPNMEMTDCEAIEALVEAFRGDDRVTGLVLEYDAVMPESTFICWRE